MNQHLFFIDDCPDSLISVHLRFWSPPLFAKFCVKNGKSMYLNKRIPHVLLSHNLYKNILETVWKMTKLPQCLIILFKQFTTESCFVSFVTQSGWQAKILLMTIQEETRHATWLPFIVYTSTYASLLHLKPYSRDTRCVKMMLIFHASFPCICAHLNISLGFMSPTISE